MVGIHDRSPRFTFMNRATDGFTLRRWRDRAPKYHSTVPRSTRLREYPPSEKRICLTAPDSARYPWDHSRQQNQIGRSEESRVGKERVSPIKSGGSRYRKKKKKK